MQMFFFCFPTCKNLSESVLLWHSYVEKCNIAIEFVIGLLEFLMGYDRVLSLRMLTSLGVI